MERIAARAQIGRTTLYRYYPRREDVLMAVFHEAIRQFLEQFRRETRKPAGFCDYLLKYLVYAVRKAPATELHKLFFTAESALWISRAYLGDQGAVDLTTAFFRDLFHEAQASGEITPDLSLHEIIRFAVRVLISLFIVPEPGITSDSALRAYFERNLIRSLRRAS
jgi:AcrR family transcriptional regulator